MAKHYGTIEQLNRFSEIATKCGVSKSQLRFMIENWGGKMENGKVTEGATTPHVPDKKGHGVSEKGNTRYRGIRNVNSY